MNNIVTPDNVPPRGKPGECFWCHEKIGELHKYECSTMTKPVEVAITIRGVIDVPISWDAGMVEFHMNESSNCIDNQLDCIQGEAMCFCGVAEGKYLKDVPTLRRLEIVDDSKP